MADEVIAPLIGVIVLVVLKADRIENQVVMNVVFVYVGGEDKFIFAAQDLPRQFHTDPVGFLRCDLPRLKRLDEVPAQVRSLVDGMAAGPGTVSYTHLDVYKRQEQGCFTSRGYLTLSGDEWEHERPKEKQTEQKPSIKELSLIHI